MEGNSISSGYLNAVVWGRQAGYLRVNRLRNRKPLSEFTVPKWTVEPGNSYETGGGELGGVWKALWAHLS